MMERWRGRTILNGTKGRDVKEYIHDNTYKDTYVCQRTVGLDVGALVDDGALEGADC